MSTAQFEFTDRLVELLEPAMAAAGLGHIEFVINPDDDGFDGGVDDSVEFRLTSGEETAFYLQVGPYGVGMHELIYNPDGTLYGSKPYPIYQVTALEKAVADAVERLKAIPVPAAAPRL